MKKIIKDFRSLNVRVYAAIFAVVLVLGVSACESKTGDGNSTPSTPTESTGMETQASEPAETTDSSAVEGMGDNEDLATDGIEGSVAGVEETTKPREPAVEEVYFDTETFQTLIDNLTAKYGNMEKKQVQAAILLANYDHVTKEDWDALLEVYSFSEEELNKEFIAFAESYQAGVLKTALYYMDRDGGDKESYNGLIKFEELSLTEEDEKIAEKYDYVFKLNASARYGVSYEDIEEFGDCISSFEVTCKRLQYFITEGGHPQQFNDISNVFT